MGTKNVFLDENSEIILKRIKEQNPIFNFSAFVQEQIQEFGGSKLDESAILKHISDAEILEKQGKDAILYWRKKQDEFIIEKARQEQAMRDKEEQEKQEKIEQDRKIKIQDFLSSFGRDSPLWQEYQDGIKDGKWMGVTNFARVKLGFE